MRTGLREPVEGYGEDVAPPPCSADPPLDATRAACMNLYNAASTPIA
jgi:hypothetical protein